VHRTQGNKEYAEAISYVKSLQGRVLSPDDPTITLYAKGEINRSIWLENDALGLGGPSAAFSQSLRDELSKADYIVRRTDWNGEIIGSYDLVTLGFKLVWNNDFYAIWKTTYR
jgi:hypothetical protein